MAARSGRVGQLHQADVAVVAGRAAANLESARRRASRSDAVAPGARGGRQVGHVEVDPNLEVLQLDDDLDFDDLAAPPSATPSPKSNRGATVKAKPSGAKSVAVPKPAQAPRLTKMGPAQAPPKTGKMTDTRTPTMDLAVDDDSDVLEVDETSSRVSKVDMRKVGGTAVRNAVQMPSGPIDIATTDHAKAYPSSPPAPPPQPLPPAPQPPRGPIAAALPTVAAMHPPQPPYQQMSGLAPQNAFAQTHDAAVARRARRAADQSGGAPPDDDRGRPAATAQQMPPHIFPPPQPQGPPPNWGAPAPDLRSLAAANEPTAQPMDPGLQAMLAGTPQSMDPGSLIAGRRSEDRRFARRDRSCRSRCGSSSASS